METFTLDQLKKLGSEEMPLSKLTGEIAVRLPLPAGDKPFYRRKAQLTEAGNIALSYVASGDIAMRKVTGMSDGVLKTQSMVRIIGAVSRPRETLRGFEVEVPGKVYQRQLGGSRLRTEARNTLALLSSTKFYRSEFCTEEFISRIHELIPVDPNSNELEWKRKARYEEYKKLIMSLESFFLPFEYDTRGRNYPLASGLEGFRPHGKDFESHAFEMEARELTEAGRAVLMDLHHEPIALADAVTKQELLSCLRIPQIDKALITGKTGMTVGFDVSNSGLLLMGISFKSPEMSAQSNAYGGSSYVDNHTNVMIAFDLDSRKEAKSINTAFLHGASMKSITKKLAEITGETLSVSEVQEKMALVYGASVVNPNAIANYGKQIVNNYRSEVSWTMPDGFRAMHRAYTTCVPLELQLNGRKLKYMCEMPLLLDGRGLPVYDSTCPGAKQPTGTSEGTTTKMMGLFANIIHSIDGYVMRRVINSGIKLLPKHDAFLIHPNDAELLKTTLQGIYSEVYEMDLIRGILKQIEKATGVEAPVMVMGDAENRIKDSHFFLSAE